MNIAKTLLAAMIPFLLCACSTLKNISIESDFEKSSREYSQLVRWHELESAEATYVTPSLREEYQKRVTAAADVKVTDYRVKVMECDPVKGEATAKLEVDYYRPPSIRVLTVEDVQKWHYEDDNGTRVWRLKTLLPEFK
jgi:hypothetical protein